MKQSTISCLLAAIWLAGLVVPAWLLTTDGSTLLAIVVVVIGFVAFFLWLLSRTIERWDREANQATAGSDVR